MPALPAAKNMKKGRRASGRTRVRNAATGGGNGNGGNGARRRSEKDRGARERAEFNDEVNRLFEHDEWDAARKLLEKARRKSPRDHWILTQLGVTRYEQRRYEEALELFAESQEIVPSCPLTLWNLAGALDALGRHENAIALYAWLLQNDRPPEVDPCWESKVWTDSLKADCAYRLGVSFRRMGQPEKAERWLHEYLHLVSFGIDGSYSAADVQNQLERLHRAETNGTRGGKGERAIRQSIRSTLAASGIAPRKGGRQRPPRLIEGPAPEAVGRPGV